MNPAISVMTAAREGWFRMWSTGVIAIATSAGISAFLSGPGVFDAVAFGLLTVGALMVFLPMFAGGLRHVEPLVATVVVVLASAGSLVAVVDLSVATASQDVWQAYIQSNLDAFVVTSAVFTSVVTLGASIAGLLARGTLKIAGRVRGVAG